MSRPSKSESSRVVWRLHHTDGNGDVHRVDDGKDLARRWIFDPLRSAPLRPDERGRGYRVWWQPNGFLQAVCLGDVQS